MTSERKDIAAQLTQHKKTDTSPLLILDEMLTTPCSVRICHTRQVMHGNASLIFSLTELVLKSQWSVHCMYAQLKSYDEVASRPTPPA